MTTSEQNNAGGNSNQPPNHTGAATPSAEPEGYQLGHRFNGEPFIIASDQALPIFPKQEDFRSWGLWDVLMRARCITAVEISLMFAQTVTNVLVAKSRDDLGLNVLRKFSKRIVIHSDGQQESKRNDEYYLCPLHRAHILSLIGGIPAWQRMVPDKAKNMWRQFGRKIYRTDREQAQKEHDEAIAAWAAGVRPYSREEKREDVRFRKHRTATRARKLHVPKHKGPPPGQGAFAF